MVWDVSSFTPGTALLASKLTQVQSNFAAMALQQSGSPVVTFVNSGIVAPLANSFGTVHVGSGIIAAQVSSFGRLVTQHGFADHQPATAVTFNNVETIVSSAQITAKGNRVLLLAQGRISNGQATVKEIVMAVRVGSLGGTVVASMAGQSVEGSRITGTGIMGSSVSSSAAILYLLTLRNSLDTTSMSWVGRFSALELSML